MSDFMKKKNSVLASRPNTSVVVMMGTKNGALFLESQLNSLASQIHQNWILIASDDGSTDDTINILKAYQVKWPQGKLVIKNGPQKGFCQNFLSMACDLEIKSDYYAFCDQDDVWLPDKLTVALSTIDSNQRIGSPFLYCGRTTYVTEMLKPCGMSPLFMLSPSFRNALVQSIAGGNTMVFNQSAKTLIEKAGSQNVPSHDWWVYQLISGAGGDVYYDFTPHLLYRQHEHALIGGNNSFTAKLRRLGMLLEGRFQNWNTQNILALTEVRYLLVKNHQEILSLFGKLRTQKLRDRLRLIKLCGLYRQTRSGTFSLFLAILFKKI